MRKSIATAVIAGVHDFTSRVRKTLKALASRLSINQFGHLVLSPSAESPSVTLGPELATNGDFAVDAAGWTLGPGWAHNGAGAVVWTWNAGLTANTISRLEIPLPTLKPGATYFIEVTANVGADDGNQLEYFYLASASSAMSRRRAAYMFATPQVFRAALTAVEGLDRFCFQVYQTAASTPRTVSKVSIREVLNTYPAMTLQSPAGALTLQSPGLGIGLGANIREDGPYGIALGYGAAAATNSAYGDVIAIGGFAVAAANGDSGNIGIGEEALTQTLGISNIAVGRFACSTLLSGNRNIAIGPNALLNAPGFLPVKDAANGVFIGYNTGPMQPSGSTNEMVVGYNTKGTGPNTAVWGNTAITKHTFHGGMVINEGGGVFGLRVEADTDENLLYLDGTGAGKVGVGTNAPTARLDLNSDILRVRVAKTPATAADAGNPGDHCWDADYLYVCVASNTWKRAALSAW